MIDFLRYRYICYTFSFSLLAIGVFGYLYNGGFKYSVDFTGGTEVKLRFDQPIGSEKLKVILAEENFNDTLIREFNDKEFIIRVKEFSNDVEGLAQKVKLSLEKKLNGSTVNILEANSVGPSVGESLRNNSIFAVLICLLLMMSYIAIRFWSLAYGVGAMIALFHDAVGILTVFVLFNYEISPNVICSILAMLGFSINDTIVIFARIRENIAKLSGTMKLYDIINLSINQTLRRTILTSFATALAVFSLLFFGGESLYSPSLAMAIGIVVGTYSSIYIASPIMLMFEK